MTTYTIARYDLDIIGIGIAHGFWALEEIQPDGEPKRLAAIHGMATDPQGNPLPNGQPLDSSDTIKAHIFSERPPRELGLIPPQDVGQQTTAAAADFLATGPNAKRRSDLGPMSRAEAVAKFQKALDLARAINAKQAGYVISGTNSNTVAKHIGELFGDRSLKEVDGEGHSPTEYNKPG